MDMDTQCMRLRPVGENGWDLLVRQTGEECGRCGLRKTQWNKKTLWEIFWELSPEYLHQGYAAEAVRAVEEYAFSQPGIEEVCALVPDTDQPGIAAALRSGMALKGRQDAPAGQGMLLVFVKEKKG